MNQRLELNYFGTRVARHTVVHHARECDQAFRLLSDLVTQLLFVRVLVDQAELGDRLWHARSGLLILLIENVHGGDEDLRDVSSNLLRKLGELVYLHFDVHTTERQNVQGGDGLLKERKKEVSHSVEPLNGSKQNTYV